MQFQHTYPEVQGSGTSLMNGQTPTIGGVPMANLRLKQLRDLARAYQIQIDMDAPKPLILPALMAAANAGAFNKKPVLEYYFRRAHRTGDEQDSFEHPIYEDTDRPAQVAPPLPSSGPVALASPVAPAPVLSDEEADVLKRYGHLTFATLRRMAKNARPDVVQFGVGRIELGRMVDEYVKEHGHEPDRN